MITSGQRAKLRGMAQTINPIFQVGKNGITESFASDVQNALDTHELVKLSVLKGADMSAKDCMALLCDMLGAEPVTAIGNRFVIYKRSTKDGVNHIEL